MKRSVREGSFFADKLSRPASKDGVLANRLMDYQHAIVKFEGDVAVLFCNGCGIKITEGTKHEDREHYCTMCMSGNCKAKFKKGD